MADGERGIKLEDVPLGSEITATLDDKETGPLKIIERALSAVEVELDGYWRVKGSPLDGWIVRGRSHDGGLMSLDVAPEKVIAGDRRSEEESFELKLGFGNVRPYTTELDVGPPIMLRGLEEVSVVDRILTGKIGGRADRTITLKKIDWEPEKTKARSTVSFSPGSDGEEESTRNGLVGGSVGRLAFEGLAGVKLAYVVAEATVTDTRGNPLDVVAIGMEPMGDSHGSLSIELKEGATGGGVVWTGLKPDGEPYPSGIYWMSIVIHEGMAEQYISDQLGLGTDLQIASIPEHFAPEHEDVEIEYMWEPKDTAPREMTLSVTGGENGEEEVFHGDVPAFRTEDGWRVTWSGKTTTSEPVDWPRLAPFKIKLSGVGNTSEFDERTAEEETTVQIVGMDLVVEPPPKPEGQAADWYAEDEIPADIESMQAYATLAVLASDGEKKKIKKAVRLKWEYDLQTADTADQPRESGFKAPEGEGRLVYENSDDVPVIYFDDEQEGRSSVAFKLPARATRQDWGTRNRVEADRFTIKASLIGKPSVSAESKAFTIGPGLPRHIRQLSVDEIRLLFHRGEDAQRPISYNFDFEVWDSAEDYTTTMVDLLQKLVTKDTSDHVDMNSAFKTAIRNTNYKPVNYIGTVKNVPFRGLFTTERMELPFFLAGYAGDQIANLRGNQSLLVLIEVQDGFGNPIPVIGDKARPIVTRVKDDQAGRIPPFVLSSATGDNNFVFGGPEDRLIAYSAFGPATHVSFGPDARTPPLGVHGFYYAVGLQPITEHIELEFKTKNIPAMLVKEAFSPPRRIPEIDDRLSIAIEVDGKKEAELKDLQIVSPGSFKQPEKQSVKALKWLILGEVSDLETLREEIILAVIPVVGDGRDIVIYGIKHKLLGQEATTFDNVMLGLAGIGLLADLGDWNPAGIALNAGIGAAKGFFKWARKIGGKVAAAALEFGEPLVRKVGEALANPSRAKEIVGPTWNKVRPLFEFVSESATAGQQKFAERMAKMRRFLSCGACNPSTCLEMCAALRKADEDFARMWDEWDADFWEELYKFGDRMVVSKNLADDDLAIEIYRTMEAIDSLRHARNIDESVVKRAFQLCTQLDEPVDTLEALGKLDTTTLSRLGEVLRSPAFEQAVSADPTILADLIKWSGRDGQTIASLFRGASGSAGAFEALTKGLRRLDPGDAAEARRLKLIVNGLGEADAAALLRRVGDFSDKGAEAAVNGLRKLLSNADDVPRVNKMLRSTPTRPSTSSVQLPYPQRMESALARLGNIGDDSLASARKLLDELPEQGPRNMAEVSDLVKMLSNQNYSPSAVDDILTGLETLRRSDGTLPPGVLALAGPGGQGGSALMRTLGNGNMGHAFEVTGVAAHIRGARLPRFSADDILEMGRRFEPATPRKTIEADLLVMLDGKRTFIDLKAAGGKINLASLRAIYKELKLTAANLKALGRQRHFDQAVYVIRETLDQDMKDMLIVWKTLEGIDIRVFEHLY